MLKRVYSAFIPDDLAKDSLKSSYASNLVGAIIISVFATPAYAALYYALSFYDAAYAILGCEIIFLLALPVMKYTHSLLASSLLIVSTLIGLLSWVSYHAGCLYAASTLWLISPILIGTFIGGINIGYMVCFVNIIILTIFYYLQTANYPIPVSPITNQLTMEYLSISGLMPMLMTLLYFYEAGKRNSLERLRTIAYRDTLTGLPNRLAYTEMLDETIKSAIKLKFDFAIYYLDIDNFKKINTVFGEDVGDILLQEVARRLKRYMPSTVTIFRVGADEFKIITVNNQNETQIDEMANMLLASIKVPHHIKQHEINVTASLGIASYQKGKIDAEYIDRFADVALNKAKKKKQDHYQYFNNELAAESTLQVSIEKNLKDAIDNNELYLNCQLQFDAKETEKVTGFEVLLRWESKSLGNVSPAVFIPIAEKIDFITPLGDWVLKESCKIYKKWLDMGLVNDSIPIAVNISPQQLYNEHFIENMITVLTETGIPATNLIIELTESSVIPEQDKPTSALKQLKEMGIRIMIDDFGAGQTSLSYLALLPVAGLKIDRAFIVNLLDNDSSNNAIIQSVIELAHKLKLEVISEGVENLEQLRYLQSINCDHIQGFYLSKPQNIYKIEEYLINYHKGKQQ